jgi:hypothetical protein
MPLVFSFKGKGEGDNHQVFECNIVCRQCTETCNNGETCRNRVCIGTPLCWMHLLKKNNLRILQSSIAGAGKGLFAVKRFAKPNEILFNKGDVIVRYHGDHVLRSMVDERYGQHNTAPYAIQIGATEMAEDAGCKRGIGSIANHASSFKKGKNAEYEIRDEGDLQHVVLVSKRPIHNMTEILVDYGSDFIINEPNVKVRTFRRR